jgi:hypothetical protein
MNIPFLKKGATGRPPSKHVSRRCFVRTTVTAMAGTFVGLGANLEGSQTVSQTTLSPEGALSELMNGNQRYITGRTTAHEHDLQVLHAKTAEKQQPFAAVLSCADSRLSNWCSIKLSATSSCAGLRATSQPRRLSPVSNTVPRSWALESSGAGTFELWCRRRRHQRFCGPGTN